MSVRPDRWLDKKTASELRIQKLKVGRWVRPSKMKIREIHVVHRRGWTKGPIGPTDLEKRMAQGVTGTTEELIVYKELERRGVPFDFQSSLAGGRLQLGGMVADFILLDRPVIIRVQGMKWHVGLTAEAKDQMQKGILESYGYYVLDIFDWQVDNAGLCEDWFRDNIDTGLPSIGGGVMASAETE